MLFELPPEIRNHIYDFDHTYKDYIQHVVLVELKKVVRQKLLNQIENMGDDYSQVYTFLTSDGVNPRLLAYDPKFHAMDRKFFNYHFMRHRWMEYRI